MYNTFKNILYGLPAESEKKVSWQETQIKKRDSKLEEYSKMFRAMTVEKKTLTAEKDTLTAEKDTDS